MYSEHQYPTSCAKYAPSGFYIASGGQYSPWKWIILCLVIHFVHHDRANDNKKMLCYPLRPTYRKNWNEKCMLRKRPNFCQIGCLGFYLAAFGGKVLFSSCFFLLLLLLKLGGFRLTYWDLDVSSFFLLTMIASSSTCLIGCLPNLVRSMCGCMATKLMGLKIYPGSYGVTGVKNVNHVKNMKTAPIQNLIMSSCRQ